MKTNKYPGVCCNPKCKARVPAGAGTLCQRPDRWDHVCAAPLCRQLVYGLEPPSDPRKLLSDGTIALPEQGPDTPLLQAIAVWDQPACVWHVSPDLGDRSLVLDLCERMGLAVAPEFIRPLPTQWIASTVMRAQESCNGRQYQVTATNWLALHDYGLLADEMGLGKCKETLDALHPKHGLLLVAPAVVKGVWVKEIAKWASERFDSVIVCSGWGSFHYPRHARECVIVNYDLIPPRKAELTNAVKAINAVKLERKQQLADFGTCDPSDPSDRRWWQDSHTKLLDAWRALYRLRDQGCGTSEGRKLRTTREIVRKTPVIRQPQTGVKTTVVFDEAHALKSYEALRTKRCRMITQGATRVYGLTGTPIENKPTELWGVLTSLGCKPPQWQGKDGYFAFLDAFGAWRKPHGGYGFDLDDDGAIIVKPGTTEILRRVMLRRTKADVGQDLPPVTYGEHPVELSPALLARLDAIEPVVRPYLDKDEVPDIASYAKVRKAMATAHIDDMLAIVDSYRESGTPLLVLSDHIAPIKRLSKRKDCFAIWGETPTGKRDQYVDAFQAGECLIFGGTIKSMGVGITLTRAAHVLIVDTAVTPAKNEQAIARVHRIGQTGNVHVTWMYSDHPLAESIHTMLIRKAALVARTLHGDYDPSA